MTPNTVPDSIFAPPGIFANNFWITIIDQNVRIVFADYGLSANAEAAALVIPRVAIVIPISTMVDLKNVLVGLCEKIEMRRN